MATTQTIKLSKNRSGQWTTLNPILNLLEVGVDLDTALFKIGNGINHWNDLPYTVSGGINALFIFLSDDPDNMLGLSTDGGIFFDKKKFNGLVAYDAAKTQGATAPTPPDEYNATMTRIGKDAHDIFAALVTMTNRINDVEGREVGDKLNDATTALTTGWSSSKINDQILLKILELKADITTNSNGAYDALVRLAQLLEDNDSMAVSIAAELAGTIRFTHAQTLTEEQKDRARQNIGAVSSASIGDTADITQTYVDATASAVGSPFEQSEM